MKHFLFILLFVPGVLYSQENQINKKIQIDIGFLIHRNDLNEDNYLDNKSPLGFESDRILRGFDIRFTIPSKLESIDYVFGAIIEKNGIEYIGTDDYSLLNGGGVYAGISPKTRGKTIGLTSVLAIGVFSYKDYFSYYRETPPPVIDIYEKKTSFGLGAMSSVGLYIKAGRLGINPQVQAVFSGGHEASFLFYGVVLPLTIQFN